MRIFIFGLVALLILGAGGAGAYFYFMNPANAAIGPEDEKEKAAKANEHAESAADHKFVNLDPLILPIIDEDGISQVVSIGVVIEVTDEEKEKLVQKLSPRLKDAYIQEMYGVLNKHAALAGGVVQVGMVKDRLHKISDRVLGEDTVSDVLLQVVQQRSM